MVGVDCVSTTFCVSVGNYDNTSGDDLSLVETSNNGGASWTQQSGIPNPGGTSSYNDPWSVSCTSTSFCEAVGYYGDTSGYDQTMILGYNGTSWTQQTAPDPGGSNNTNFSYGVSCTGPANGLCIITGYYGSSSGDQAMILDSTDQGATWTQQTSPNPSNSDALNLATCAGSSFCTAVGTYRSSGVIENFALYYTLAGSSTTIASSANPITPLPGSPVSVTYTATVTGSGTVPTGTVEFLSGGVAIAGCNSVPINSSGIATCSQIYGFGTIGSFTITATYSGNANYAESTTSVPVVEVVV